MLCDIQNLAYFDFPFQIFYIIIELMDYVKKNKPAFGF
jgi:hypothetical protein